jgi:hypothetical protein
MKSLVCLGLLGCLAVGCGGSDGGSGSTGNVSSDPTECGASATLSGGLEHELGDQPGCSGTDTSAAVFDLLGQGMNLFGGGSIGVTFEFDSPPALGQTGPASLSAVSVRETAPQPEEMGQFAETLEWEFPAGACTLDIQSTAKDDAFSWLWFHAEGSCEGSAAAVAPNTKAPVSLGAFSVNTFVSLPE